MFYIENLGLEFLTDTTENAMSLCRAVCTLGKPICGYYNRPYFNHEFGWPQFIVRTGPTEEGTIEVMGMDAQLGPMSRILYAEHGSRLIYGYLGDAPTAPGQWSAERFYKALHS